MTDYIVRITHIMTEMLAETDDDGAPMWTRPGPYDRSDSASQFRAELSRRLRIEGDREALTKMAEMSEKGDSDA